MKTLEQIVDDCKDGFIPSTDDLRLAVCCLDSLMEFSRSELTRIAANNPTAMKLYEQRWEREKRAFARTPSQYLGDEYNPDRPEVQERRKQSKKIAERFLRNQPATPPPEDKR